MELVMTGFASDKRELGPGLLGQRNERKHQARA